MSMELIVDPIQKQKIVIKNKDELIKELKDKLVVYNKKITKENVTEGKQDRARLNKLFNAVDARRKEIKSEVMTVYEEVELDFKEITDLIKKASNRIDVQVKNFEDEEKAEKKEIIKEYFESTINFEFVKFEDVFNSKWLNVGTSMKSIQEEIDSLKIKINTDLDAIKQLESKYETTLLSKYYKTREIGKVILEKSRLEKIEAEQEKVKELQEKAIQKVEQPKQAEIVQKPVSNIVAENNVIENKKPLEMYHRAFEVWGNRGQIIALSNFMNENGIEFKKIEGVN